MGPQLICPCHCSLRAVHHVPCQQRCSWILGFPCAPLQIEAQPTLALGTQKGRVAREALAEITRSQLPPQLAPQPLPQLPPAAARIHSWVQDAAQGDTSSEAGAHQASPIAKNCRA